MQDLNNSLIVSAIGEWRDDLIGALLQEVRDRGCTIHDCRSGILGSSLSAQLLIAGNWSAIGKLETALPAISQKLDLQINALRNGERSLRPQHRPFAVEINAPQHADLLSQICGFFASQGCVVAELVCQDYCAGQTGAAMINVQAVALVPLDGQPPSLREAFMDLCDDLNADGILDPIKS